MVILLISCMLLQTGLLIVFCLDRLYKPPVTPAGKASSILLSRRHRSASFSGAAIQFEQLSIRQLRLRFPDKSLLLKDISLDLKKGEIAAIAGDSGQGKSHLLQVLQKQHPYNGGKILVNGHSLQAVDTDDWQRITGFLPQDVPVFGGTVLANICMDSDRIHLDRVKQFCETYGFHRFFESLPRGYATLLGEGGMVLSGGQRQLLALARCLYRSPQLLLLDEPTSAMDALTERFVIAVLQQYRQRAAMVIVSHRDSLTSIADRVYLLDRGTTYRIPHLSACSGAN